MLVEESHNTGIRCQWSEHNNVSDDPHVELAVVEAHISKITAALQRLTNKTHMLKARINDDDCLFLRLLPPELISEIFEFCLPPTTLQPVLDTESDSESETSSRRPSNDDFIPLILGAVCNKWRRIAWQTPTLWASVNLYLSPKKLSSQITLLEEWLARSGNLPLYINLASDDEHSWSAPDIPGQAIKVITEFASRWKSLHLQLPTSCYASLPTGTQMPMLTGIHVDPVGGQTERRHQVDMRQAATVTHVGLSCVYLSSMFFKFDKITHLTLQSFYVDECLKALSQTPQIVECTLQNLIDGDDGHGIPEGRVILPRLKSLTLDNFKDSSISQLLDMIEMPNATDFTYSGRNLIHITELCSIISRSTTLHTFSLIGTCVANEDVFIQLLSALKSIKKLVLDYPTKPNVDFATNSSRLNDNALQLCNPTIAKERQVDCLLPSLECLKYTGPQSFTWKAFMSMMNARALAALRRCSKSASVKEEERRPRISVWSSIELNLTRRDADVEDINEDVEAFLRDKRLDVVLKLPPPQEKQDSDEDTPSNVLNSL